MLLACVNVLHQDMDFIAWILILEKIGNVSRILHMFYLSCVHLALWYLDQSPILRDLHWDYLSVVPRLQSSLRKGISWFVAWRIQPWVAYYYQVVFLFLFLWCWKCLSLCSQDFGGQILLLCRIFYDLLASAEYLGILDIHFMNHCIVEDVNAFLNPHPTLCIDWIHHGLAGVGI